MSCLSLFLACGSKTAEQSESTAPAPASESEGVLVAKEILATFDRAVAEAAQPRPEGAELKAKVEAIFEAYKPKMEELNARYPALKDRDVRLFGEANISMGENRGRHVYEKDLTLGDAVACYNFQKGDRESAALLSVKLIELIEIAVKK